jgi:hypothetical protein
MQVSANQITPGENFDLFYFLRNPLDSATYYVRAKLYDLRTGVLIDTQTLSQSSTNGRLFTKTMQAPPDPSGYGRNIVAVASVYTDSAFTTQSDAYEEQEQYYLIKAAAPILGGGGVDVRGLRDMLTDVLRETLPVPQTIPLDSLFGTLGVLQREINRIPKEAFDVTGILSELTTIRESLSSLPAPQDITPLSNALEELGSGFSRLQKNLDDLSSVLPKEHSAAIEAATSEIAHTVKGALASVVTHLAHQEPPSPAEPVPSPISVSHLF